MPKLKTDDARELARHLHAVAVAIGEYRFSSWDKLSRTTRAELESMEWTLLNDSSDMTTRAIVLQVEDMSDALEGIRKAAKKLSKAAASIQGAKSAIKVGANAIALAAAIVTGNAGAIAESISSI